MAVAVYSFHDPYCTDSEMDMSVSKFHCRQKKRQPLRLATSSPLLQHRYQSDEEQPSPWTEEDDAASNEEEEDDDDGDDEEMETEAEEDDDSEYSGEDEISFEDLKPTICTATTITPAYLANAVPIVFSGRASLITISVLAPRARGVTKVTSRPSRPTNSHSIHAVPIPRRSSLRDRAAAEASSRSVSLYETSTTLSVPAPSFSTPTYGTFSGARGNRDGSPPNFSTPLRHRSRSPAAGPSPLYSSVSSSNPTPQLLAGSSSSSCSSSVLSSGSSSSEADESEAVHILRSPSSEQTRASLLGDEDLQHEREHEALATMGERKSSLHAASSPAAPLEQTTPAPNDYSRYDRYALSPPKLRAGAESLAAPPIKRKGSLRAAADVVEGVASGRKAWKGLGLGRMGKRGARKTSQAAGQ